MCMATYLTLIRDTAFKIIIEFGSLLMGAGFLFTHRIKLEFSQPPKNPAKDFSFGRNLRQCDVVLDAGHGSRISNVHFYVTFDHHRNIILIDESTHGTAVTYSNQISREMRRNFEWILDLNREGDRLWEVEVYVPNLKGLSLNLVFSDHSTCKEEYSARVDRFLANCLSTLPPLHLIGLDSPTADASTAMTPRKQPIYLRERKTGSGALARVYLVIDVSTGKQYAQKEFHSMPQQATLREIEILK
ncbi:hypothetical protein TSTA_050540 [Talaromyces stipitatus ATCC 10500]|uniref:FHA domain-containing protein n=1 Tax=Talaromyces stipitatus (strain ATCC 10500 / CBS 375.48 / QM 6759 / NRRL 1006) TaxID=441959 RepID=B8MIV3_TALSN|nr:uncharacterized protein TSTA_050540 [Talaromyces stipitatus ATCC 10500]EED15615.1 hypothetical protein TSTA_050540 [Talaromyces stipitatus ATCC 10500]